MTKNEEYTWETNKHDFQRTANEAGLSIEESDSIYCRCNCPEMTEEQFALICNRCGKITVQDKIGFNIESIKTNLCANEESCRFDFIEKTQRQELFWIPDIFTLLDLKVNDVALSPILCSNDDYKCYIFTTSLGNEEGKQNLLVFYRLVNEKKHINFLLKVNPDNGLETADALIIWENYLDELFYTIKQSLSDKILNNNKLSDTIDGYIRMYYAWRKYDTNLINSVWPHKEPQATEKHDSIFSLLRINTQFIDKYDDTIRRQDTIKALKAQSCPVCKRLYLSSEKYCSTCGFFELNKVFVNKDEYQHWFDSVIIPKRAEYKKDKSNGETE